MVGYTIGIDWPATIGRWASRYPTTLVTWAVGVVALVMFKAWGVADRGAGTIVGFFDVRGKNVLTANMNFSDAIRI